MNDSKKKNLIIALVATSLSSSAALVPVLSALSKVYPGWENWIQFLVTIPPLVIMVSSLLVNLFLKYFTDKQITIFGLGLIVFSGVFPYFIYSFPLLLLSRIIMGFGLGIVSTISSSLPYLYFPSGKGREMATGLQASFSSFGGIIFSILSGLLANIFWKNVFLIQLLNLVPLIVILLLMTPIKNPSVNEVKESKPIFVKEALPVAFFAFITIVFTVTFPLNLSFIIDYKNIGTTNIAGIIASINAFIGFIIGLLYSNIYKVLKNKMLSLSFFLISISFLLVGLDISKTWFYIGSILFGIASSMLAPTFLTLLYKEVPEDLIVPAVGMYTVASNISQFISPLIINPIANFFGGDLELVYRFIFSAIVTFLLGALAFLYDLLKPGKFLKKV